MLENYIPDKIKFNIVAFRRISMVDLATARHMLPFTFFNYKMSTVKCCGCVAATLRTVVLSRFALANFDLFAFTRDNHCVIIVVVIIGAAISIRNGINRIHHIYPITYSISKAGAFPVIVFVFTFACFKWLGRDDDMRYIVHRGGGGGVDGRENARVSKCEHQPTK